MLLFIGNILVVVVMAIVIPIFVLISLFIKWYKKPKMGTAIVRTGAEGVRVCFEKGIFVIPVLHQYELLDITMKTFSVDLSGQEAIILENGLKIDVKVVFYVRIPNNQKDVLKVATAIGCERASKRETVKELFYVKFSEMIKEVAADLEKLSKDKAVFREKLLHSIGNELNGFTIDDCSIEYLKITEQNLVN